ncbi:MAG: 30S ribosomal protein S4 [Nanoarchaeota archaeon]
MGDPKKLKKKYTPLAHPWIRSTIEEGKTLKKEYGLTKYKEILIASSFLKKYKDIAKKLIADKTVQGEKEKKQMMDKLQRYGLLQTGAGLDQVLSIQLKDVLERRLQSIIFRKGFARTMKQARQFITHRHVSIGNQEITSPGYMLTIEEENVLNFKSTSSLSNADHPERVLIVRAPAPEKKEGEENKDGQRRFDRKGGRAVRPIKRQGGRR